MPKTISKPAGEVREFAPPQIEVPREVVETAAKVMNLRGRSLTSGINPGTNAFRVDNVGGGVTVPTAALEASKKPIQSQPLSGEAIRAKVLEESIKRAQQNVTDPAQRAQIEQRYRKSAERAFQQEMVHEVEDVTSKLARNPAAKAELEAHIYTHALEQQYQNPEQYVSHGFDHSINVKKATDSIIRENPKMMERMRGMYGLTGEEAEGMMGLMAIYHDFGYPASEGLGKSVHAVTGAEIVSRDDFRQTMRSALAVDDRAGAGRPPMSEEQYGRLMHDFKNGILFHGADKVEEHYDAKIITTRGEFLAKKDKVADVYSVFQKKTGDESMTIVCTDKLRHELEERLGDNAKKIEFITPETVQAMQAGKERERAQEMLQGLTQEGTFGGRTADLESKDDKLLGIRYQKIDAMENPLLFTIRMADNMDMTPERFSEIQRHPAFRETVDRVGYTSDRNGVAQEADGLVLSMLEGVKKTAEKDPSAAEAKIAQYWKDEVFRDKVRQYCPDAIPKDEQGRETGQPPKLSRTVTQPDGTQKEVRLDQEYIAGVVDDVLLKHPVDSETRDRMRDVLLKQDSASIRHFRGCDALRDVQLQGDTLTVKVNREEFDRLNESYVPGSRDGDLVPLGEYQIWRAQEAFRAQTYGGQKIKIRAVDEEGVEVPLQTVKPEKHESISEV